MPIPHPLPYQGSKRKLAPQIRAFVPERSERWYEPFAGSIAMTIYAAHHDLAEKFVIGDSLGAICHLWEAIISDPKKASDKYSQIWHGQKDGDHHYFYHVRERFNETQDPIDFLYLTCRCVKNAVRFNQQGGFSQSSDKRRKGMSPLKMRNAMQEASRLLRGRIAIRHGDWLDTVGDARAQDFVYLDPPYSGVSSGPDKRYANQLSQAKLIDGLHALVQRRVPFALSYDGHTGTKTYSSPLPTDLGMSCVLLNAGRSSQSTLVGRNEETFESLYSWPPREDALKAKLKDSLADHDVAEV